MLGKYGTLTVSAITVYYRVLTFNDKSIIRYYDVMTIGWYVTICSSIILFYENTLLAIRE